MVTFSFIAGVLSFVLQISPIVSGYPEWGPATGRQLVVINQGINSVVKAESTGVLVEHAQIQPQNPVTTVRYVELKEGDAMDGYIRHHPAPT